jgi:glycosyltransferase involved in cell wall biosynthesis
MKILIGHNTYQQAGGEDIVAAAEARLLAEHGHEVVWYRRDNDEVPPNPGLRAVVLGLRTVWASDSYRAIKDLLKRERPAVAHFHNTFPLVSPSAYFASADAGVPVVQTLHNYRLLCPSAMLFRDARPCEDCLLRAMPWPGVLHRCYRHNGLASLAVASMLSVHRALGTWKNKVNCYIAVSEFARRKFVEGGLPAGRIRVKANFVDFDPGVKSGPGGYALFIGRLSEEKGIASLMKAWRRLRTPIPLLVAGEGPLHDQIAATAAELGDNRITVVGAKHHGEIPGLMHGARFLVFPSTWYEGFPLSILEAFACGLPVVASRIGSMADTIVDGKTGLHFEAGNASDLAAKCDWAWQHPEEMQQMGRAARAEYEAKYTPEKNYEALMDIYRLVRPGAVANAHAKKRVFHHKAAEKAQDTGQV